MGAYSLFAHVEGMSSEALTVSQLIKLFLEHGDTATSAEAQADRRRDRQLFVAFVADKLASDCRGKDLIFFLSSHKSWKSDWTRLRVIRTIRRPFTWAYRAGVIDKDPFAGVSGRPGPRGRPMTLEERQKLLRASAACFRRVLVFMALSGARPGELRQARWSHLDLERGCFVFADHKTARTRRDGAPRTLILHPVAIKLLLWIRRSQLECPALAGHGQTPSTARPMTSPGVAADAHVFLNSRGRPWTKTALDLRLYRLRKRLGIEPSCKLYSARHGFATRAVLNGVDLATLAELLGHTSTAMSMHYVHLAGQTDHLREAVIRAMKK